VTVHFSKPTTKTSERKHTVTVDPEYQQQLEAANAERDQLLATISDQLGALELDDPPSLAPISINSDGADDLLAAAAAATTEIYNDGPEVGDKGAAPRPARHLRRAHDPGRRDLPGRLAADPIDPLRVGAAPRSPARRMSEFDLTPAQAGLLDEIGADALRPSSEGAIVAKVRDGGMLVEIPADAATTEDIASFDGPEVLEAVPPPPEVPADLKGEGEGGETIEGEAEEIPVEGSENPDDYMPPEQELGVDVRAADIGAEVARAMDRNDEVIILNELQERAIETMVYAFEQGGDLMVDLSVAGVNEVVRLMNERGGTQVGISEQRAPLVEEVKGADDKDYFRVLVFAKDARFPESGRWGTAMEPKFAARKKGPDVFDKFALAKALSKAQRNALKALIPEEWRQVIIAQSKGTDALQQLQPTGGGEVAKLPPPIEGPKADAVKAEIHAAYKELRELNRLKMPPARFNAYLTKAETESLERLELLRDTLLELAEAEKQAQS
jgi:hypothetical protein